MVSAESQFHVGIVVADLGLEVERLGSIFGFDWSDPVAITQRILTPAGPSQVDLTFRYSKQEPHVELIQEIPGTAWTAQAGSGLHHLGYWSDDLVSDAAALEAQGYQLEARDNENPAASLWAYYTHPSAPRVELVSRTVEPMLSLLFL